MKLSIVIPVYNVEPYLERCLNSVFNQLENEVEIEVIIVNDGSSDMSLTIAEGFSKRYSAYFGDTHPVISVISTQSF